MKCTAANSIKDKDEIEIIKLCLKKQDSFNYDRHLLYFILGINTCLKPSELLKLEWNYIIDDDLKVKEYIAYHKYKFYLNNSCKTALYNYIFKYNSQCMKSKYVFGNKTPMNIATMNYVFEGVEKELSLSYNLSTMSLRKTFVYWQVVKYHYDYNRMSKLRRLLYDTQDSINNFCEYNINDDMIYINDINL